MNWPVKVKKGNGSDLAVSFYRRGDDERSYSVGRCKMLSRGQSPPPPSPLKFWSLESCSLRAVNRINERYDSLIEKHETPTWLRQYAVSLVRSFTQVDIS